MNVKQKLSILFYLKRNKINRDGKSPLYARVTIDGLKEEISTGCKVCGKNWDNDAKTVLSRDPEFKKINKKIVQLKVDLERHFDLKQAKPNPGARISLPGPVRGSLCLRCQRST